MSHIQYDPYSKTEIGFERFEDAARKAGLSLVELKALRDRAMRLNGDRSWLANYMSRAIERRAAWRDKEESDKAAEVAARDAAPKIGTAAPICTWCQLKLGDGDSAYVTAYDTNAGVIVRSRSGGDASLIFLPGHKLRVAGYTERAEPLYEIIGTPASDPDEATRLRDALREEQLCAERAICEMKANNERAEAQHLKNLRTAGNEASEAQAQVRKLMGRIGSLEAENKKLRAELAKGGLSVASGEHGTLAEVSGADGAVSVASGTGALTVRSKDSDFATNSLWRKIVGR